MSKDEPKSLIKYGSYAPEAADKEAEDIERAASAAHYMRLVEGRNVIRILPPRMGKTSPFRTIFQHYLRVPGASGPMVINCLRMEAKQLCPVCVRADKLKASGNPADRDAAWDLFAKRRVFANVIDRKAPDRGVLIVGFGKQIHEQLVALRRDEEAGGDFSHPVRGFDVVVERTGSGKTDTKYKVRPVMKITPLSVDAVQAEEWLAALHNLDAEAALMSAEKIAESMAGGERERQPGEDDAAGDEDPAPRGWRKSRTAEADVTDAEFEDT